MPMPASPLKIGFGVPFHEAIKAAQQRKVVLPDVYYGELQGVLRQMAFSIAGLASFDQLQIVRDSLSAKLQSGQTFNEWQKDILESGTLDLPRHQLDNIFRTNVQSAYNRGRWQRFEQNKANRPCLMYDGINDNRIRPAHKALDGIIRYINDPFWDTYAPLNGYRCRCRLISLTEAEAQKRSQPGSEQRYYGPEGKEVTVQTAGNGLNKVIDERLMKPDKGWGYNPGKDVLAGVQRGIANREGKDGTVLLSALKTKLANDMHIISKPGFDRVQETLTQLAGTRPEWFPSGFNGIHAVTNAELFAGFRPKTGAFYLSTDDELVPGFKPADELQDAVLKIKTGDALTFNNEYAVETLWHEMLHGITGITAVRFELGTEPLEEGIIQAVSRLSYPALLTGLGGEANHQSAIITHGYAYPGTAGNILTLIAAAGLEHQTVIDLFMQHKTAWKEPFAELLSSGLNIKKERINTLYGHAIGKALADFKEKIAVLIRNAPRNSHE